MAQISLRPELVTPGGQANGIMCNDRYAGSLTLMYREEDRIWGTVQLDEEMVHADEKRQIDQFVHRYIQNMIDALAVPECLVTVTYSEYDHVISTEGVGRVEEVGVIDDRYDEDADLYVDEHGVYEDEYAHMDDVHEDEYEEALYDEGFEDTYQDENIDQHHFRLTIVGESRNRVEYQIHNLADELVAESIVRIARGDVAGEIVWHDEPDEEEIDAVAQLMVMDFNPDEIDTFTFVMVYDDMELATIELTHEDLYDVAEFDEDLPRTGLEEMEHYVDVRPEEDRSLTFDLIRDDMEVLIYHIYEEMNNRTERIGIVTIDIATEEMTALVDFINPRDVDLREQLAYHLIEMMEEGLDFETFTITMQYDNEVIDEYVFDEFEQPEMRNEPTYTDVPACYHTAVHGESDRQRDLYLQ